MFLFCLVFAMFCARLFICALWSPAGKGLTSWLSFVVSSVSFPCENEVGFIGTVLELSGTHFNGTFWDNHLIPINPNIGIIWY